MNFCANRGLAIACRLSVRLSVCEKTSAMWASLYKDALGVNLKQRGIDLSALGDDTQDRSAWRTLCHETGAKLWNIKEQFGRGFNLAETSTLGHVTVALASAAPELDSTLINKLTDDKRSVILDGVIRSVPCTANQSNRQLGP